MLRRPSPHPSLPATTCISRCLNKPPSPPETQTGQIGPGQVATRPLTPQNEVGSAGGRGQSTCVGRMAVGGGLGGPTAEPGWHRRACVPHGLTARRQLFRRRTSIIHLYTHTHTNTSRQSPTTLTVPLILHVVRVCVTFSGVTNRGRRGSCPRAQQARGRKTASPKILVHCQVTIIFGSVCLFVCLFACAEFFSTVFDPISIKLGHMLYV